MYSVCKRVYFSDVVKDKIRDDLILQIPCKMFDGSLNVNKHKMTATFCMRYLNSIKMNVTLFTIAITLKYIQQLGVLKYYSLYEFIYKCKSDMNNILTKLENIKEEMNIDLIKSQEKTDKEQDPYWDLPIFVQSAKKRCIKGASLIPKCSRDSLTLAIKLTIEWIPTIKQFITFLQDMEEYLFFKLS